MEMMSHAQFMVLDVRHLRLIETVAEHGSLTRAGHYLHLTQSALSHQLRDLESALGAPLFHRSGKRMVPTQAGSRLLETARQTLRTLESAETEVRRIASGQETALRLSTECYTCYHWLPRVLASYRERFPHVNIQVDAAATHAPLPVLLAGKLDLAIVLEHPPEPRVRYATLFDDENVVIMPPDHRFARKRWVEPADLEDESLFLYAVAREESTLFRRVLDPAGVNPKRVSTMQLTEAIVELVKGGLGVSVLARWAVASELEAGTIVARPLGAKGYHRRWYAATLRDGRTPPHLAEFIRLIATGPGLLRSVPRPRSAA
jgi:LysR family transcriptional regulator, regulator for metE and metH